jgi:ribonuclease HII
LSNLIAGIDEVGRGCLAGPVVAAAVILNDKQPINGLADSKKVSHKKRLALSEEIKERAVAWSIGRAEVTEIDDINILQASLLAMKRAYCSLNIQADFVRVDGTFYPDIQTQGECIKSGDAFFPEISAASIIAKVYRDEHMQILDVMYPGYFFSKHKGYPTPLHKELLASKGISLAHRRSFSPVSMYT